MNKKTWKLYLCMAVVFVSGVVVGICGTGYFVKSKFDRMRECNVTEKHEHIMRLLKWKLKLSNEQEKRIQPIVLRATGDLDAIRRDVKPSISKILETTVTDIERELTPKQQKKFKKFYEHVESRWR